MILYLYPPLRTHSTLSVFKFQWLHSEQHAPWVNLYGALETKFCRISRDSGARRANAMDSGRPHRTKPYGLSCTRVRAMFKEFVE